MAEDELPMEPTNRSKAPLGIKIGSGCRGPMVVILTDFSAQCKHNLYTWIPRVLPLLDPCTLCKRKVSVVRLTMRSVLLNSRPFTMEPMLLTD